MSAHEQVVSATVDSVTDIVVGLCELLALASPRAGRKI